MRCAKAAEGNKAIMKRLKYSMHKQGLDPDAIDDPDAVLPDQVGSSDAELKNDMYEKGLRLVIHDSQIKILCYCALYIMYALYAVYYHCNTQHIKISLWACLVYISPSATVPIHSLKQLRNRLY